MDFQNRIPDELLYSEPQNEDISVIIGENGSGKSSLLNDLAKHFTSLSANVLGIANSIHDKFEIKNKNFNVLRGRQGRMQAKKAIKKAIQNIAKDDIQRFRLVSQSLRYVGFEPRIGFKLPRLKTHDYRKIIEKEFNHPETREDIYYLLERIERQNIDDFIWLEMDGYSFEALEKFSLINLFLWEAKLEKLKIITSIEVFLTKNNQLISLLNASSGELSLITSIVYLATIITKNNTVILIDEPENSLHPKWQREYVKHLLDIFYLYQPKIIIATHSPIIINGAEIDVENSKIFRAKNFELNLIDKDPKNIEELYYELFGITTPENRFIPNIIINQLNKLASKKITKEEFYDFAIILQESMYDNRQKKLIEGVLKIAEKI